MITFDEKQTDLRDTDFSAFLYLVKRYGYNEMPFDDILFAQLCPELGVDHTKFDNERGEDKDNQVCQTYKCAINFKEGTYNVRNLVLLGFLYCKHSDIFTKKEDFWGLINPSVDGTTTKEHIKEVF